MPLLTALQKKKIKDHLHFLKKPLTAAIKSPLALKKSLSQTLRKSDFVREVLHLPSRQDRSLNEHFLSGRSTDKWKEIHPGGSFLHPLPQISNPSNLWFFEQNKEVRFDPVGVATLQDGYFFGHNGGQFLDAERRFIWDLGRENYRYFGNLWMDCVLRLPPPTRVHGKVGVLVHEYAYDNFSHWVFDVLPKVKLLEEHAPLDSYDAFLVGHTSKPYQVSTLDHLGINPAKIIKVDKASHIQASQLVVPRLYGYNSMHHRSWALDYLADSFGSFSRSKSPNKRLFISRSDASFRILHEEDHLLNLLKPFGFKKTILAGVPLGDTIDLFAEAEMVVGPFGSGLMNIAFCRPQTKVAEIITPSFYNCYHWYLAGERGLSHSVFVGDGGQLIQGRSANQSTKNIHIDPEVCAQFIAKALGLGL